MSQVYNPESGLMEQIERLARNARDLRERILRARNDDDRKVMSKQASDMEDHVRVLQTRLPD
ncbi:MAG: hypothetical protein JWO31_147 [Phycisphaerales bacterium]|nr:hypothetical protein [Phycisphaerales bacterium]